MSTPTKPMLGLTFGRLYVVAPAPPRGARGGYWACRCECGATTEVRGDSLRSGAIRSCGCLQKARAAETCRAVRTTHGASGTPEHGAWSNARYRCNDPSNRFYPDYGGRGIRVCARWDDFAVFLADMGPRPSQQHSLDRIDNHGNYEPDNCRWATKDVQHANRRRLRDYVARIAELEAEVDELRRLVLGAAGC